jgi:spore coat protein U-like protein
MVKLEKKGNTQVLGVGGLNQSVVLYKTCIVNTTANKITLDTGGFNTPTTKNRMNQASQELDLKYNVYSKKGIWFVSYRGEELPFADNRISLNRGN